MRQIRKQRMKWRDQMFNNHNIQIMKSLQNPTTYFFKQAQNPPDPYREKIDGFVNNLINKKTCLLCKEDFNLGDRVPRIMIHCGHSFCSLCLLNFFINRRVRCPMCLKLVKHLDSIDRLPINHTIFTELVQADIAKCKDLGVEPEIKDAAKYLFSEFERVQKQAHQQANPQKIDPDSGLPFCTFHPDRVEHFFCCSHKIAGCRVCAEIGHTKPECSVVDLYEIEDPKAFMIQNMGLAQQQPPAKKDNGFPKNLPEHNNFIKNQFAVNANDQFNFGVPGLDDDEEESINSI